MTPPRPDAPRKPGRPKDDTLAERRRAQIVVHAIDEFARRGFTGADLETVAASAGCSKGTLYNYFDSKVALFAASVDFVMADLVKTTGAPDGGDPMDDLVGLVHGFLRYFAERPHYVELLVQERSDFRDRETPSYEHYRAAKRQDWTQRFERMMADGRMRAMPPERAVILMGDLLYGTIFMNHFRGRRADPQQQATDVLHVLLGGLLTEAGLAAYAAGTPRQDG